MHVTYYLWPVRRLHFFPEELVPVYSLKEDMRLDVLLPSFTMATQTTRGMLNQELTNEWRGGGGGEGERGDRRKEILLSKHSFENTK